jgi:hypothetical protein
MLGPLDGPLLGLGWTYHTARGQASMATMPQIRPRSPGTVLSAREAHSRADVLRRFREGLLRASPRRGHVARRTAAKAGLIARTSGAECGERDTPRLASAASGKHWTSPAQLLSG